MVVFEAGALARVHRQRHLARRVLGGGGRGKRESQAGQCGVDRKLHDVLSLAAPSARSHPSGRTIPQITRPATRAIVAIGNAYFAAARW